MEFNTYGEDKSYENFIYLGIKLTNNAVYKINRIINSDEKNKYVSLIDDNRKDEVLNIILEDVIYDFYLMDTTVLGDSDRKTRLMMTSDTENINNRNFMNKRGGKILCVDGVNIDKQHFLVTNLCLASDEYGNKKNNCYFQKIKLCTEESIKNICISNNILSIIKKADSYDTLVDKTDKVKKFSKERGIIKREAYIYRTMPIKEKSNLSIEVQNRIDEWDHYLKIIEDNARHSQLEIKYKGYKSNSDFTKCTMNFKSFTNEEIEKLQNFRNDRVILFYDKEIENSNERVEDNIGSIYKINIENKSIVIELNDEFQELLLENKTVFPNKGYLRISKMGDLAQAINLRRGLYLLKSGQSLNNQLATILFDTKNLEYKKEDEEVILNVNNLLLNTLNNSQIKAVQGALNSKDVFVIQGPPGTGKTTVIAEICYQNAIRGLKTLIASQSNLAVDNALGRIIDNPRIRALRTGNLSRVESEGEKYTEGNVVKTWLDTTLDICKNNYKKKHLLLEKIVLHLDNVKKYEAYKENLIILERNINKINTKIKTLEEILNEIKPISYEIRAIKSFAYNSEQLSHIKIINSKILRLKKFLEVRDNEISISIINELNNLYENNYSCYCAVEKIAAFENEIRFIKNSKKYEDKLESFENFVMNFKDKDKLINGYKEYRNINCQIKDIRYYINLLNKYLHIINNRVDKLVSLKIKYNINHEELKYNIRGKINNKLIDKYLVDTANVIDHKPIFLNLIKSLGIISNWETNLLKYIYMGNEYVKMIKEKIEELSILMSNLNKKRLFIEDEYEEIIYSKIKTIKKNIDDIKKSLQKEFNYDESSTDLLDFIIDITTNTLNKNTTKLYFEIETEKNKAIDLKEKYNNLKYRCDQLVNDMKEVMDATINIVPQVHNNISIDEILRAKSIIENYLMILDNWIKKIEKGKFGDKEELKKLYIEFANVIGITCVQSGSKKFESEYKDFDVVIIDESSKATPPELLLPMLKGKKIILVGDHKQLPPVIESELLDEMKYCDDELEDIKYELDDMKNSIFEKIYMNINEKSKIMLDTQYRMHSSIMNCINQFYKDNKEGGNKVGLISGVKDEEKEKSHNIDIKYIKKENHLMWVDIPLKNSYAEERNDGFSFYNKTEIEVIEKILTDINKFSHNEEKQVSVITFYSAQVKLFQNNFLKGREFKNLNLRVGTVDRFQGIESEIVIVSLVRNNNKGKIGFAKDPRRINVALSRAQKLLIIVGCSELYCEKNNNKEAKGYYSEVIKVVNKYNGVIDAGSIFN